MPRKAKPTAAEAYALHLRDLRLPPKEAHPYYLTH